MIHPSIQHKIPAIIEVLKKHKVKRAYAFGSVCTDKFDDNSDVDFLIAFENAEPFDGYAENFWAMEDSLEHLLNRPVDLVPEHTLQNPYFIKVLEKTKTPLYE